MTMMDEEDAAVSAMLWVRFMLWCCSSATIILVIASLPFPHDYAVASPSDAVLVQNQNLEGYLLSDGYRQGCGGEGACLMGLLHGEEWRNVKFGACAEQDNFGRLKDVPPLHLLIACGSTLCVVRVYAMSCLGG